MEAKSKAMQQAIANSVLASPGMMPTKASTLQVNTPNKPNRQTSNRGPFQSITSPQTNSRNASNKDLLSMVGGSQQPKTNR